VREDDDPQRTQEMDSLSDADESAPGATAARAEAQAAAAEAAVQAERTRAQARAAEVRADVAQTDARRAEEETSKAHERVESAEHAEEKLSRKQRKARERAEQAAAEAGAARRHAEEAQRLRAQTASAQPALLGGNQITAPGLGSSTDPAAAAAAQQPFPQLAEAHVEASPLDRPEVQVGIAFGGAFILARILKRLVD
jgi:hypothetical protein